MRAIQIRFLPATNFLGARMKAFVSKKGSITLSFQYEISNDEDRAILMAQELITKLNWINVVISGVGQIENGDYVVTIKNRGD